MRRLIFFLIYVVPLFANAQQLFTIKGYGKGFKDGDKIFMLYREYGAGKSVADSTNVVNGAFTFKGKVNNVTRCGIYRNTNPMYTNTIEDQFTVYLETGEILLKSADTLKNSIVSGTPSNTDYMQLLIALNPILMQRSKLKEVAELSAEDQKNPLIVANLTQKRNDLTLAMHPIQFDFIRKHLNSYVSLATLELLSTDAKLLTKVENIFPSLNPKLRATPMAAAIVRRIEFAKRINVGMMAKDFTQPDVNGKPVQLSSFKGKYLLVDFWASWCLPCREENPNVVAAYQKYRSKGFEVLGISLDDKNGKSAWLKAIKDDGLAWHHVADLKGWKNDAAVLYGVTSIPSNVLIDPSGKIIAKNLKGEALNTFLEGIFK